jgi:hypothetical protein
MDVTNFLEGSNAFTHNWHLARTIVDFLNGNRMHRASVDGARVVPDWNELPFIVKYRPIFLDDMIDQGFSWLVEVGQIKLGEA